MASIEPYETGTGRRYRVRYRDPEMRSKERAGFRTRRDAELFIASVTVASGRGEYIDSRDARVTVGDLGPAWLAAQLHLKPSSYGVLESEWRVYVEPRWRDVELGRVRHSEVQLWVKGLVEGVEATERELIRVLGRHGVTRVDALGQSLDPNRHQAMLEVESAEHAPGTVVAELQAGYTIKDRLLRPSLVSVARAGPAGDFGGTDG